MSGHLRILVAVLVPLGAGAVSACNQARAAEVPRPPAGEIWLSPAQLAAQPVRVAPVAREDVSSTLTIAGKVAFDDLRVAHVYSPVTGRITRIFARPGQRVRAGDPLARLSSPEVGSAHADLVKAQADLTAAEHELRRQQELVRVQAGSRRDYEAATDGHARARAEYLRAEERTRLLRAGTRGVTQEYTLRAPIDGEIVARSNVNPGTEVVGQYGGGAAPELFTVGRVDSVWVVGDLFESDLGRVQLGSPVRVKVLAYPERTFTGTIDWISAALDPVTRTAKVRCAVANPERLLKPEMVATLAVAGPSAPVLAVPRNAVVRLGDQATVFVDAGTTSAGQRRFLRRRVTVEEVGSDHVVAIRHGLRPGDRVVSSGVRRIAGLL